MYLVSNRMVHGDTKEFLGLKNTTAKLVWSVYNSLKFRHTTYMTTFSHFYFLMGKRGIASQVKKETQCSKIWGKVQKPHYLPHG